MSLLHGAAVGGVAVAPSTSCSVQLLLVLWTVAASIAIATAMVGVAVTR